MKAGLLPMLWGSLWCLQHLRFLLTKDMKFAPVLKFLVHCPPIYILRWHIFKSWGYQEVPMVSVMDKQHVLLQLALEKYYLHAWPQES